MKSLISKLNESLQTINEAKNLANEIENSSNYSGAANALNSVLTKLERSIKPNIIKKFISNTIGDIAGDLDKLTIQIYVDAFDAHLEFYRSVESQMENFWVEIGGNPKPSDIQNILDPDERYDEIESVFTGNYSSDVRQAEKDDIDTDEIFSRVNGLWGEFVEQYAKIEWM